jgi:hypothetical protein
MSDTTLTMSSYSLAVNAVASPSAIWPQSPPTKLSTDGRTQSMINALIRHGYVTEPPSDSVSAGPSVKSHMPLKCLRNSCGETWSAVTLAKCSYKDAIFHVLLHRWDAGNVMQRAVDEHLQQLAGNGASDSEQWISPPPKLTRKRKPEESSSVTSSPMRATSSAQTSRNAAEQAMAHMIAGTRLPLSWIDDPLVRKYHTAIGAQFEFNRQSVTSAVQHHGKRSASELLKRLRETRELITVAIDSVTNVKHHKIYSVVLLGRGTAW